MRITSVLACLALGVAFVALAAPLDTNVSNEFWCTYAYTNAVPSVTNSAALAVFSPSEFNLAKTAVAEKVLPKGFTTSGENSVLPKFNSNPPTGAAIIVR